MAAAAGWLDGAEVAGAVDAGGLSPEAALRGVVLVQPASPAPAAPAMSKNFRRSIGTSRTVLTLIGLAPVLDPAVGQFSATEGKNRPTLRLGRLQSRWSSLG
jgi:hypothetical protein